MQDIADLAGVKKMVVSNALNGTRNVAPATKERVQKIARELNYLPNLAARALATGRTGIIVILTGPMNQPYYAEMVHLLEEHISADGFKLMLMRTPTEVQELGDTAGHLAVDGAIALDMMGLITEIRSYPSIPCVSIGTFQPASVDNVIVDLSQGVGEVLHLMLSEQRTRIAYLVTAGIMEQNTEVRARTYRAVMGEANRAPEIINVLTDDPDRVEQNLKAYIGSNGCPDALLCQNDEVAMCAFRVLRDLGRRVPEDVLLAGCDGQRHMRYLDPPLATIAQPMQEMCAQAWQFLQRRMAQPDLPHQQITLRGTLIIRPSLTPQPQN